MSPRELRDTLRAILWGVLAFGSVKTMQLPDSTFGAVLVFASVILSIVMFVFYFLRLHFINYDKAKP